VAEFEEARKELLEYRISNAILHKLNN